MKRLIVVALASLMLSTASVALESLVSGESEDTAFASFQGADRDSANLLTRFESESADVQFAEQCCKICTTGKACGNSCINRNYQCHQPPGCACDG